MDSTSFTAAALSGVAHFEIASAGTSVTLGAGFTLSSPSTSGTVEFNGAALQFAGVAPHAQSTAGGYSWLNHGAISTGGTLSIAPYNAVSFTNAGTITAGAIQVGTLGTLVNSGQITVGGGTILGTVSGDGTTSLTGTGSVLGIAATVGSSQVVALTGTDDQLALTTSAAETGFAGPVSGFAKGDQISFANATITTASFKGLSLTATLSTGATLALATSSALSGTLAIANSGGNALLTYGGAPAALQDWSAGTNAHGTAPKATVAADHAGWLTSVIDDALPMHWLAGHAP